MSARYNQIVTGLRRIAEERGPAMLFDGEVVAVDAVNYFCDVQLDTDNEGAPLSNCRLRASSIGNKSIDVLPVVGSSVVIAKLGGEDYLVIACDQISDIRVSVDGFELQLNSTGIALRNEITTLKAILTAVVTQMLAIYAPKDVTGINNIQVLIDSLLGE